MKKLFKAFLIKTIRIMSFVYNLFSVRTDSDGYPIYVLLLTCDSQKTAVKMVRTQLFKSSDPPKSDTSENSIVDDLYEGLRSNHQKGKFTHTYVCERAEVFAEESHAKYLTFLDQYEKYKNFMN